MEDASDTLDVLPIDTHTGRSRRTRNREKPPRRRPTRWWLLGVAAIAVGAGMAFAAPWAGDHEPEAADPLGDDAVEAGEAVDFGDLIDGATVALVVEGLPHSVDTVTVQCAADGGEPSAVCDPTSTRRSTSSPNGTLQTDVRVWRVISTAEHGSYDCARRACELRTYPPRPVSSVATSSLGFDPQNTAALPPAISTAQVPPTSDDVITLRADGLAAGTGVTIRGCPSSASAADPLACDPVHFEITARVDQSGQLRHALDPALWDGLTESRCTAGCRIDFEIDGLARQPFSIHLPRSSRAGFLGSSLRQAPADLTVTPDTGLHDGQEVTIEADGLTTQMSLFLCADREVFDCTWLRQPADADTQTVRLPRAFVSWLGGMRDCAEVSCQIVVLGPMQFEDQVSVPVSFDPTAPLEPGRPLALDIDGPIPDGATVTISTIDARDGAMSWPNMAVCAVDRDQACEYVDNSVNDQEVTVELNRTILTPAGSFDCVDDGACELLVWVDGSLDRFEPLLLEFDPEAPPARPPVVVTIRPGGPLADGQEVEVVARGLTTVDFNPFLSVCVAGESRCAFMGSLYDGPSRSSGTRRIHVRRLVTMQSTTAPEAASVVDCAEAACELRLLNVRGAEPVPLVFTDSPPLPTPQIALGQTGPLPSGELIDIRGRDFTFFGLEHDLWVQVELCPSGDGVGGSPGCYNVGGIGGTDIDVEAGTFAATIVFPDPDSVSVESAFGEVCSTDCLLVVGDGIGPPAVLPVTVRP